MGAVGKAEERSRGAEQKEGGREGGSKGIVFTSNTGEMCTGGEERDGEKDPIERESERCRKRELDAYHQRLGGQIIGRGGGERERQGGNMKHK